MTEENPRKIDSDSELWWAVVLDRKIDALYPQEDHNEAWSIVEQNRRNGQNAVLVKVVIVELYTLLAEGLKLPREEN